MESETAICTVFRTIESDHVERLYHPCTSLVEYESILERLIAQICQWKMFFEVMMHIAKTFRILILCLYTAHFWLMFQGALRSKYTVIMQETDPNVFYKFCSVNRTTTTHVFRMPFVAAMSRKCGPTFGVGNRSVASRGASASRCRDGLLFRQIAHTRLFASLPA